MRKIKDLITFFKILPGRLNRLIEYAPIIWKDWNFDFRPGFYKLTGQKIKMLVDSDCSYQPWNVKEKRRMLEAVELCKRLAEDWDWEEEKLYKDYKFNSRNVMSKKEKDSFWRFHKRTENRKEAQKVRLFHLLKTYGHSWWN